jgi:hypothetical protein
MQKDFMSMAQGQQAPAAAPQEGLANQMKSELQAEGSQEELQKIYQEAGMPIENTPEAAKQRLMMVLEELGVLKGLRQDQLQQIQKLADEYIKLAQEGNMQALEQHPISQLLNEAQNQFQEQAGLKQPAGGPVPQQGGPVPQQAAPTDFASMMPPTPGGGMGGR